MYSVSVLCMYVLETRPVIDSIISGPRVRLNADPSVSLTVILIQVQTVGLTVCIADTESSVLVLYTCVRSHGI